MTTPDQPFTAELVAKIANELFQAVVPAGGAAPLGGAASPDAAEHALANPATTADVASTSVAPAPNLGVLEAYNLSTVPLGSFDEASYRSLIDDLDVGLLSESFDHGESIDSVVPGIPSSPGDALEETHEVDEVLVPQVGSEVGQFPDAGFLAEKLAHAPTDPVGLLAEIAGEHPYLQGQYHHVLEESGVDDAGVGDDVLTQVQMLAGMARDSLDGVPDLGTTVEIDVESAPPTTTDLDAIEHQFRTDEFGALSVEPTAGELAELSASVESVPVRVTAGTPSRDDEGSAEGAFRPILEPAEVPHLDVAPTTTGFDAHRIRQDFPILHERINGHELVWLDNGATTQKPRQVIDRLSYFYEHENSNVHRTAHTLAGRATDAYEGARDKVRRFINASSSDEIVWVRGTTEGINLVANTYGEQNVCEGDEVLISHLEHHANIVPWQMLCRRKGAQLRVIPVDDTGQIILSEYERLITPRTKIIAFTQVSNALGTITPAKAMVEIAHRHGVPVLIDGAQGVLHMPVDVQDLDCDFYVFSGHKMFAPTGIGVVYGRLSILEDMPPWQGGGNMIDKVYFDRTTFQPPPWRFEAGTGSIADAVGLGAAVDYLEQIGMASIEAAEQELLAYGTEALLSVPGLSLYGHADHKAGVLSFNIAGCDPVRVGEYLDRNGIAVRAGHHCAQPILRRFGTEATVRAALALYNTKEDLDRLVEALQRLVTGTPDLN